MAIGPDESHPFHGFPYPPIHSSTPLDFGQLLDDTATSYEDSAIGGWEEVPLPFDSAAASLAEQSQFYSPPLDKVELFTEGADLALLAVQELEPGAQRWVEVKIQKRGRELQAQLNWAETSLQDEAIEEVQAIHSKTRQTPGPPCRPSPPSPPMLPGPPSSPHWRWRAWPHLEAGLARTTMTLQQPIIADFLYCCLSLDNSSFRTWELSPRRP